MRCFLLTENGLIVGETNWFVDLSSGMPLPIAHVEESWQMAEFYNNKVCYSNGKPRFSCSQHKNWRKKHVFLDDNLNKSK